MWHVVEPETWARVSQQNSTAYEQYKRLMKSRRAAWKL